MTDRRSMRWSVPMRHGPCPGQCEMCRDRGAGHHGRSKREARFTLQCRGPEHNKWSVLMSVAEQEPGAGLETNEPLYS